MNNQRRNLKFLIYENDEFLNQTSNLNLNNDDKRRKRIHHRSEWELCSIVSKRKRKMKEVKDTMSFWEDGGR